MGPNFYTKFCTDKSPPKAIENSVTVSRFKSQTGCVVKVSQIPTQPTPPPQYPCQAITVAH